MIKSYFSNSQMTGCNLGLAGHWDFCNSIQWRWSIMSTQLSLLTNPLGLFGLQDWWPLRWFYWWHWSPDKAESIQLPQEWLSLLSHRRFLLMTQLVWCNLLTEWRWCLLYPFLLLLGSTRFSRTGSIRWCLNYESKNWYMDCLLTVSTAGLVRSGPFELILWVT